MPVVKIDMWDGRTDEQKSEIIKGITEVFEKQGVSKEKTTIIINEVKKNNWGLNGDLASKND
ncbi:MAG: 2-hydroxymuconate tautomerase [Nanoarchaeota archaeon]